MNKQTQINKLLEAVKQNKEGFTLKLTTLKPYKKNFGCAVSITNIKSKKPLTAIKKVLFCVKGFSHIKKNLFVGGWFNHEDNFFYLDLSLISNNQEEIKTLCLTFKQIAYFNFKNFETIKA